MEDYLRSVRNTIPCRDAVLTQLYSLIGADEEEMPETIFLYGHVATGKTLIINHLLNYLKYRSSIINCVEHPGGKHVFEYILSDLMSKSQNFAEQPEVSYKCDSMLDFVLKLRRFAKNYKGPLIIVFDRCDRFRDIDANFLPAFLRLKELTGIKICTIFISDIVWEKYNGKINMYEPIKLFFPQYTKEEMAQILMLYKPDDYDEAFYKNYLNLFLSVFFLFCRDLNELRYMAKINFAKYVEPIESLILMPDNVTELWKNISSTFKSNLEVIYLRVSADNFQQSVTLSNEIESTTKLASSFELPFYAKYMLIAAYLASYNPAKEDKRLFMKQSSKQKKRATINRKTTTAKTQNVLHNFPVSRMLAICCFIVDEKVDLNANLLAQIPTMCQLGLLSFVGENNLDEPKLKCCISYEFACTIAKMIGFNLKEYLYDHMH